MVAKFLVFIFSVFPLFSFSQNFLKPNSCEVDLLFGKILKNHPEFPQVNSNAFLASIHICNDLDGSRPWHKHYNASIGFNFIYGSIGNQSVLGNVAGFIPEMIFKQKLSDKLVITESAGIGISYFNKPYNQISNPENIVIGSHITFCAMASVNLEYSINKNVSITLHPGLYHSSNSHTALPNVGMNLPVIGVGVKYEFYKSSSVSIIDSLTGYNKKINFNMRLGLGINEQGGSTGPSNGPKYPIYLTSFYITKNYSLVNKVQLGIEGWYNTGVYDYIISQDYYYENEKLKSFAATIFLGHEFLMGHFSLVAQGGIYIYNPFYRDKLKSDNITSVKQKLKTVFTARLGYQYYFFDSTIKHRHNLYTGIYVKTNLGQADFLDTGIGYTF